MPFTNQGVTTITTYNDVAGDLYTTNVSYLGFPYSSTTRETSIPLPGFPTKEPYSTLVKLIYEAQQAFHPIPLTLSGNAFLQAMYIHISNILTTTSLAGRLVEILEQHDYQCSDDFKHYSVWISHVSNKVPGWTKSVQLFVDEVRRYKNGLEFTMIGPIWRRVIWSVMFSMSAEMNIEKIVLTAKHNTDALKEHLEKILAAFQMSDIDHEIYSRSLIESLRSHVAVPHISFPFITVHSLYSRVVVPPEFFLSYCEENRIFTNAREAFVESGSLDLLSHDKAVSITNQNFPTQFESCPEETILSARPVDLCLSCEPASPLIPDINSWKRCLNCQRMVLRSDAVLEPSNVTLSPPMPKTYGTRYSCRRWYPLSQTRECISLKGVQGGVIVIQRLLQHLSSNQSIIQDLDVTVIEPDEVGGLPNIFLDPPVAHAVQNQPIVLSNLRILFVTFDEFNRACLSWDVAFPRLYQVGLYSPDMLYINGVPGWLRGCASLNILNLYNVWISPFNIFDYLPGLHEFTGFYEMTPPGNPALEALYKALSYAKENHHPISNVSIEIPHLPPNSSHNIQEKFSTMSSHFNISARLVVETW